MAEFLTTQGTAASVENIIINAKNWLFLISPYLDLSQNFYNRLLDADNNKVKIVIVYGKNRLKPEENAKLEKLQNLSLLFCNDLHAKCYLNEECLVISSMNMYEYSEKKNREMGVLVRREVEEDRRVYEDALREVKSIVASSVAAQKLKMDESLKPHLAKTISKETTTSEKSGWAKAGGILIDLLDGLVSEDKPKGKRPLNYDNGHCIRCGTQIPYDPSRPYCRACFSSWLKYENPSHIEKFCHTCGIRDRSSMLYPQCHSCFKKSQRY